MDKIDQRLTDLYRNWQAEYKDAITSEECKEIRRFYKPYLEKYESKYRILYQMLQQAIKPIGQTSLLSTQEHTSETTPSLAALDDAQYSTVSGHLMPTPPKHKDMRMDSTLDVTPEGFLSDLPATVGGAEETGRELQTCQSPEEELQEASPSINVIT